MPKLPQRAAVVICLAIVSAFLLGLPCSSLAADPPPAAWRIGVGGGWATGYQGILSLYGLPCERILDSEMASAEALGKFRMVFLSYPTIGVAEVNTAVEQYVRDGGIAVYENPCIPSESLIPGRRIPPQKGPNIVFTDAGPLTAGLVGTLLPAQQHYAASIIPSDSKVKVLARYTDQGAKADVQGKFIDGNQGSPAIIMADCGKGKVVWVGITISTFAALYGRQYAEPLVVSLVKELSQGQVVPRFVTQMESAESLISEPRLVKVDIPRPKPKATADKDAKATVLEESADNVSEFDLYGKLAPGAEAVAYLSYYSSKWNRAVKFSKDAVSIVRTEDGKATVLRSAKLVPAKEPRDLVIKRRWGYAAAYLDGVPVVSACDGAPLYGTVAATGITDPGYQPIGRIYFTDDFMRTANEANPWETVSGTWQMVQTEGQPSMGANPFRYQGISDTSGIATHGDWFWDDYAVEMSVFPDAEAQGIVAHYQSPDSYILVRVTSPADGKGKLSIIEKTKAGEKELASAPVVCEKQRWYKLGARLTSGVVEALLDGKVVATASDASLGSGAVGMYVEKGKAQFDDVLVQSWRGTPDPASGWGPWEWQLNGGTWQAKGDAPGVLDVTARDGGRALTTYPGYADYRFTTELKVNPYSEAGLFLRYRGRNDYVLATLARDAKGQLTLLMRQSIGDRQRMLGSVRVAGEGDGWHRLEARAVGHDFALQIDGKTGLSAHTEAPENGAAGLFMRGLGQFRGWALVPVSNEEDVNNTPTPPYAGIIDKNTWAGRAGVWRADPTDVSRFWHTGYFPGDVDLRMGVYKNSAPSTTARVSLGSRDAINAGETLTAETKWGSKSVRVTLLKDGKSVASGVASLPADADRYCLALRREGDLLVAAVNDADCLSYVAPKSDLGKYLAFTIAGGGLIHPNDIRVASGDLRTYTFDAAPTDWFIKSGTWQIASRWSCTPGWTWFAGWDTGEALIRSKPRFTGDTEVQFYVGAKMMATANGGYTEAMRDIIVGLCGSEDPTKGYRFVVQSSSGGTYLMKDGVIVARATDFTLSQVAIHNDWTHFTARKEGKKLTLMWWGRPVLEYEDPTPIDSGCVWLGTSNNGILIPRVTIYGKQVE